MTIQVLTEEQARSVASWCYDGEYDIYNCPPWEKMQEEGWGLTNPSKLKTEFRALCGEERELIGFFRLMSQSNFLMLAIGLRPDLCGHGLGSEAVALVEEYATADYPDSTLRLEVRAFNQRAFRCYQKAGFTVVKRYFRETPTGLGEFFLMEYLTPGRYPA